MADDGDPTDGPLGTDQTDARRDQVFDRAMRRLAESDVAAFCRLLDVPLEADVDPRARLLPTTFAGVTQTVDLLVRVGRRRLLHVEYQRRAEPDLPVRMLGYRAAIMRSHPWDDLDQWIVVLGGGSVPSIDHGDFRLGCRVLYLRDVPIDDLLAEPHLVPLAVLGRGTDVERERAFAAALLDARSAPPPEGAERLRTAHVLAGIRLDRPTMEKIWKEAGMSLEAEADYFEEFTAGQIVRERGREQGREEALAVLLRERFGDLPDVDAVAARLAHGDLAAAYRAILSATSFEDVARAVTPV